MAFITLSGTLLDPNGDLAVGDQIRFTHKSTTGETLQSAVSIITVNPAGTYSLPLQYGLVLVEYKDVRTQQFKNLGVATVNGSNPATSIPELLNALVPVSSAELIEFQAILADCVTAQTAAENAATTAEAFAYQLTTTDLIASTATFAASTNIPTSGFTTSGDGGNGSWKQTGVTAQTPSQSPAQLGDALLNDGNGNQWGLVFTLKTTSFSVGTLADYSSSTQSGTDNSTALQAYKVGAQNAGAPFNIGAGHFYVDAGRFEFDKAGIYQGNGIDNTVLYFGGSPIKTQETFIKWRAEYNIGDYANSADDNISYAIKINVRGVVLRDFSIATATEYDGYSTPWDSITDAPTSNYDYGLLINEPECVMERVNVLGAWAKYGGALNGTAGAFGDKFSSTDNYFSGMTGFGILGAEGEPISGDTFEDLAAGDTRTRGGMSDLDFHRTTFYSTFATLKTRLEIDGTNTRVRRVADGVGGLYINGQAGNAAGRIQGIYFFNCRVSGAEATSYKINYANRVEFLGLHSDKNSDAIDIDGSSLSNSDFNYVVTENATNIKYIGGKASGGVDGRVKLNTNGDRVYSEFGFEAGNGMGLSADYLTDTGTFEPEITGDSGSVTYGPRSAHWVKIGNLIKIWGRIDITTLDDISGTIIIPLPFTAANIGNSNYTASFGVVRNFELLDGFAGSVDGGDNFIDLYRYVTNGNISTLQNNDISDGARIGFSVDILI